MRYLNPQCDNCGKAPATRLCAWTDGIQAVLCGPCLDGMRQLGWEPEPLHSMYPQMELCLKYLMQEGMTREEAQMHIAKSNEQAQAAAIDAADAALVALSTVVANSH